MTGRAVRRAVPAPDVALGQGYSQFGSAQQPNKMRPACTPCQVTHLTRMAERHDLRAGRYYANDVPAVVTCHMGSTSCLFRERSNQDSNQAGIVLWLIASYLIIVFIIPLMLSVLVSYRSLPAGRTCPHCTGETI